MSELLAAVIGALVGGVASYLASSRQWRRETDRQRRAVATAMLAQIGSKEGTLHQIYGDAMADVGVPVFWPGIEAQFADHVALFSARTVQAVFVHQMALNELLAVMRASTERIAAGGDRVPNDAWRIQLLAAEVLTRADAARRALVGEGGAELPIPPAQRYQVGELPPVPPRQAITWPSVATVDDAR